MPQAFDTVLGHFEPLGQCAKGCAATGWNMTLGLCPQCFRSMVVEDKQRELDELWGILETVRIFDIESAQRSQVRSEGLPPPAQPAPVALSKRRVRTPSRAFSASDEEEI